MLPKHKESKTKISVFCHSQCQIFTQLLTEEEKLFSFNLFFSRAWNSNVSNNKKKRQKHSVDELENDHQIIALVLFLGMS